MTTPTVKSAYAGIPAVQTIPTNIRAPGVMSNTSLAAECFINQRFSAKLQAFMVAYVSSIDSNYSVYGV